ncbi:MAG TPA: hypothetical protein DCX54_01005 [Flavobacteriales bacterium]|nr:hypothetical protein [Flavobacteriales bacterium]
MESMDGDEDLVVEFEDGRSKMKVMKIKIDCDDMDEITTIDLCMPKLDQHSEEGEDDPGNKSQKSSFRAFPNPAKDHINIEFEVMDGNAVLNVKDVNGKILFTKEYKEPGKYSEQVKFKGSKSKIIFVELNEKRRLETQKIIVD